MIKTEFCFPQLNAENRYLFPSHCLHLQDIKEANRAYQFRRGRKQDRKIGKKKSCWKPARVSVKFNSETCTDSIQVFGHVVKGIFLTAKVFAGSKYFCAKEMLNNSIYHVSFHSPSSTDNLHQSLDAF